MLASIVLALIIALGGPTGVFAVPSTTPTSPPAEASPDATVAPCATPDTVVDSILSAIPDADIKSITTEPPYTITFTSPSMPTDYVVVFDENGCAVSAHEIGKVGA